jgi:hypothetical protein
LNGLFSLSKVLLFNLGTIRSMNKTGQKKLYRRPKPMYVLPQYQSDMKSCDSEEKYLRPTLFCNSRSPEVIALAHELGAYTKTPYNFANAAFEFAKRKVILEICPLDDVSHVLRRGTGTCIHKISLFIALCRAAGIPARYKFFALTMLDTWMQPSFEHAPLMRQWYDAMGFFMLHGEGEVFIDGQWVTADVGAEPDRQAASDLPVTKLGEDSIGLWLFPIPGTLLHRESIPMGLGLGSRILMKRVVPNQVSGINIGILEQIEKGRKIIQDAGGEAAYDALAREKRMRRTPTININDTKGIVFGDK